MSEEPERHQALLVRPYALTRGRVHSHRAELEIETLVSTSSGFGPQPGVSLSPEQQTIAQLCRGRFQSVAEVSALLHLPLGVVRVLVGDMADRGLVDLYQPTHAAGERPRVALLERVLDGLRKL